MATSVPLLPFGKYQGRPLDEVPNSYLGWLTTWHAEFHCCEDLQDCIGDCGGDERVRCIAVTHCPRAPCCSDDCKSCSALAYLARYPQIVSAARELVQQRRLCVKCWTRMPAVGHARQNGKNHADWDRRFLHKACWRAVMDG